MCIKICVHSTVTGAMPWLWVLVSSALTKAGYIIESLQMYTVPRAHQKVELFVKGPFLQVALHDAEAGRKEGWVSSTLKLIKALLSKCHMRFHV